MNASFIPKTSLNDAATLHVFYTRRQIRGQNARGLTRAAHGAIGE
jgi:hypothetical protein